MKTIVIILLAAHTVAAITAIVICSIKSKQVRSLSAALLAQQKETQKAEVELKKSQDKAKCLSSQVEQKDLELRRVAANADLLRRINRLQAEKPKKVTAQYLAMKMSGLLEEYFVMDGNTFYLDVVAPERPVQ